MVPKNMQNLVLLMEPSEDANEISLKGGNMCLNLFSIDEDAAFELSDVYHLKKPSRDIAYRKSTDMETERISKGKGYSSCLQ